MATEAQRTWHSPKFGQSLNGRNAKLTPQQRYEIGRRLADGESPKELAAEYGVNRATIYNYR